MSSKLTPVFNKHFIEFLDDVSIIFPDNVDIQAAKNGVIATKKVNPALIIKIWHQHIATPYLEQIMAGDVEFFINKDYSKDVLNIGPGGGYDASKIMASINRLIGPIRDMSSDDQQKSMKYIQNLTKLSMHHHTQ
jgi:hypothetical protein